MNIYISSYLSKEFVFLPTHRIYSPTQTIFFVLIFLPKEKNLLPYLNLEFIFLPKQKN